MGPAAKTLVIIPTYNERENIEHVVELLLRGATEVSVLIVDDGSPDGTGQIADLLASVDERVNVLHRSEKSGLGSAYIAGFDWGLSRKFDVLVEMDADGSHNPEAVSDLIEHIGEADVVLGSRWISGGRVVDWPASRVLLSRVGNLYVRVMLGMEVRDATGGFRAYRRHVLEQINYTSVASQGYCFQVDLVWRAVRAGYRIAEVPITFEERKHGHSKMSRAIVLEALVKVSMWGSGRLARRLRVRRDPRSYIQR